MTDCKTTNCKTTDKNHGERGVALLMALMVLLLLTALAAALVFMSNIETSVNANYKKEQVLYFAARAGIEEARDRLRVTNPDGTANASTLIGPPLGTCVASANHACLPSVPVLPSGANGGVFYILGGQNAATVTPWTLGTTYTDDELCHDAYAIPTQTPEPSDVRCIDEPAGAAWYSSTTSNIPWNSTAAGGTSSAALPYEWVRITLKLNSSVASYQVHSGGTATTPACWDGQEEILLAGAGNCASMTPPRAPVYLVTSLAVDPISKARRMVQAELAFTPNNPFPYGLFATGTGCSALQMGGGATTDSFTTAGNGTYSSTQTNTGGDVGSNGNVFLNGSNTQVGGLIGVPNATIGACPAGLTEAGGAGPISPPNPTAPTAAGPFTFPAPPLPNPLPPDVLVQYNDKTANPTLNAGTYGNIQVGAGVTLTLTPGIYNINSILGNANSTIVVNPPGAVVLNVAGQGSASAAPVTFLSSATLVNSTGIANNFQINYGGTGTVLLSGGSQTYAVVNAPHAAVTLGGNSDFYGSIIGQTIADISGVHFHYDLASKLGPPNTGAYNEISFRDVMY